ncbi:MAG: iron ABC transporter permease [Capsulimonadales bacterium]|nr:iron ABC transporter permease [Capsulimonadales bacterium]
MTRRLPFAPVLVATVLLLLGCLLLGTLVGEEPLPPDAVARAILHSILRSVPAIDRLVPPVEETVAAIVELRLPRVLLAALVGAALSVAGTALQGLLGNPLADPYTIGVSSGAAVGAGVATLLGLTGLWGGVGQSALAFAGAVLAMLLVFALARVGGRVHTAGFLLAGIVCGSFLWAIVTLLLALAREDQRTILLFLMGRLSEGGWPQVAAMAPVTGVATIAFLRGARGLDAFAFGEEIALSVGVETERFKGYVLGVSALLTAVTVSVSGIIGFVGLIVPHLARFLVGPPHRGVLPLSALLGGSLLILADLLARTIRPGEELPVGVITALLGAPAFLVLLRRQIGND